MNNKISNIINDNIFVRLGGFELETLYLKIEALNPAGSIKLKTAIGLVESFEKKSLIKPDTILIESSSGNLGVALSLICAERGYQFTCVVDPNTSQHNIKIMKAFGTNVVCVTKRDDNGGFLGTRIAYVCEAVDTDDRHIWLNQYANPENPRAHARTTAKAIAEKFAHIDYLFVGAGTTGTLMGCVQYFAKNRPETKIVAVDSIGSVTFGMEPGKRYIPGLGTSQRPKIFSPVGIHAVEMVAEADAVKMCRYLARTNGILVGGSSGTVLAGVAAWRDKMPADALIVAISPDFGERYLDTIYDDEWVAKHFPQLDLSVADFACLSKTKV